MYTYVLKASLALISLLKHTQAFIGTSTEVRGGSLIHERNTLGRGGQIH